MKDSRPLTIPRHGSFSLNGEKITWLELRTDGGQKHHFTEQLAKSYCRKFYGRNQMVWSIEELWREYNLSKGNDDIPLLHINRTINYFDHDPPSSPGTSVASEEDVSFGGLRLSSKEAMFIQAYSRGHKDKIDETIIESFMATYRPEEPLDTYTHEQIWLAFCKIKGRNPEDPTSRAYPCESIEAMEYRVAKAEREIRRKMAEEDAQVQGLFSWLYSSCLRPADAV